MKKHLAILSFGVLLLLVVSQIVWIMQVAERDKSRFKEELGISLNEIVKHQATKQTYKIYGEKAGNLQLSLEQINPDSIPSNTKSYGSLENTSYNKDKSLSKFLEAAMTELLFEKDSLDLKAIDSLLLNNFPHYKEVSTYGLKMQNKSQTTDSLYYGKNAFRQLSDTTTGVYLSIPLGTSGTYRFVSHFVFKPSSMTRNLMFPVWLSGIAVIAVGMILFLLFARLQQQRQRLQRQEIRVRGIVHDLKSPLSYLYTMLGIFESGETNSVKKEQLLVAKSRTKRLTGNIERMLSEVKLSEDKAILQYNSYNLRSHSLEIVKELQEVYKDKTITFELGIDSDANILYVDPFYFDSCIYNLLENAIKYSGYKPVICVSAKRIKDKIEISIADNGSGILVKDRKKVFEPFYRSETHSSEKGYGLGLSVVRRTVQNHKGRIVLESTFGKGSVFTIMLPYKNKK
ncbi:HAMP domain-containing sensor histidine kinase [Massilibacteroides sp.]|uniref:sensor histidine kinase n=1 Tax=Massilibacteroides sp. TaxID=2034766 RepID=UPI0026217A24|nr:HAMP domain-containing sensor histidine kinase [Massilibacteroides sp.]MDD4516817.1 HAMP domain-containing sensor histidine kinase [Massilibacteroides sp.]